MKAGRQLLAIILVLALAAGGWFMFGRGGESGTPTAPVATGDSPRGPAPGGMNRGPVLVVTAPVEVDVAGEDVRSIGTLAAAQDVILYPEVTGIVAEILVAPNQTVATGDVLVRLDDEDQKVEVERATIARDDATAARARTETLFASKNATAVAVADAKSVERKAAIDLKIAEIALAKRAISAPFAGTAGITDLSVGDLVTTSKQIATLTDMSTARVSFEVPERVAGRVAVGQAVTASTPALPGRSFAGAIRAIDNRLDATSRTLRVEAELPNQSDVLKPGMSVAAILKFPSESRPMVPSVAVQWDRQGSFVWKLDGDVVRRTPIAVVQRRSGSVTVTGDLAEGDEVVIEGLQRVREGSTVVRAPSADGPAAAAGNG